MYTPDARQQWVGWHSRIVGKRGGAGAYLGGVMMYSGGSECILKGKCSRLEVKIYHRYLL